MKNWRFLVLKVLYVYFRNSVSIVTPVAVKWTAGSILLLMLVCVLALHQCEWAAAWDYCRWCLFPHLGEGWDISITFLYFPLCTEMHLFRVTIIDGEQHTHVFYQYQPFFKNLDKWLRCNQTRNCCCTLLLLPLSVWMKEIRVQDKSYGWTNQPQIK